MSATLTYALYDLPGAFVVEQSARPVESRDPQAAAAAAPASAFAFTFADYPFVRALHELEETA